MGPEIVTVKVGGNLFSAFTRVDVTQAIDEAALSFTVVAAAESGAEATAWLLAPGKSIEIRFNDSVACVGFIDRFQPHVEGHDGREIRVSGRSKAQDFVDCAALHDTGNFANQTLLQIAQKLDQFGVGITTDQELEQLDTFQLTPGETAFRAIEKKLRSQGLTFAGQRDGSLKITKASATRHAGGLFDGINCAGLSGDLNWAHRHSKAIVRGQQASGHGDGALQVEAESEDTAIGRFRPVLVIADDDIDEAEAQKRADTRLAREAGESLKASIRVQGFRDDAGTLWTPGFLVWTESAFLGITQVMLIEKVTFSQDRNAGSTAVLDLIDPRAFEGKAPKSSKSRDAWTVRQSKVKPGK